MTDRQYGDQYDNLFPDIDKAYSDLADRLDEPLDMKVPSSFLWEIEDIYKELWGTEGKMPTKELIEAELVDWIADRIMSATEEEYKDDPRFWEDEEYRIDCLEAYEEFYWNSEESYMIDSYIREALDILGYTYIDDDDIAIKNPAQNILFPEFGGQL